MSHLSAEACTQRMAAGRGDGYQLAAATAGSVACSYRTAEHWTTCLAVKPLVSVKDAGDRNTLKKQYNYSPLRELDDGRMYTYKFC